jgi:hypothetical protein
MAETRMGVLRKLAQTGFGSDGIGAGKALASQESLDVIAKHVNATECRSTGRSAFEALKGYVPETAVTALVGDNTVYSSPFGSEDTESWLNRLTAIQELVATATSVSQFVAASSRDAGRVAPRAYALGELVLVWYPSPGKLQPCYRGPFVIDGKRNDNWYTIRRLADAKVKDAVLTEAHVSRLRPFNASRTTVEELLAYGLGDDYGVVKAILRHRTTADGSLEFEVKWQDDSTSFLDGVSLGKVTLFKEYIASHKIGAAQLKAVRGKGKRTTEASSTKKKKGKEEKKP